MAEAHVSFISLLCPYIMPWRLSNSPGSQLASFKVSVAVGQELLVFMEGSICHVIAAFSVVCTCTQEISLSQVPRNHLSLGFHLREPSAFSLPLSFRRSQSSGVLAILWSPRSHLTAGEGRIWSRCQRENYVEATWLCFWGLGCPMLLVSECVDGRCYQ